jgi:hypothetical protein
MNPETDNFNPVLLSRSELEWLCGDTKVSKSFEYKIRSNIKKKIQTLTELELPLLVKSNFLASDYNYELEDDGLGRDLEPGPQLHSLSMNSDLVRQRSRVQIPAKASSLFCKKEEESEFF